MALLRFLLNISPRMTLLTGVVCLISGGFNGGLIAVVHHALTTGTEGVSPALALVFAAVGLGKLVTGFWSEVMLTRRAQQAVTALSIDLVRRLQRIPLRAFERIGRARIHATFSDDIYNLSDAFYALPTFAFNVTIVLGGCVFMVYLSPYTLLMLGAFTLLGAVIYGRVIRGAHRYFHQSMRRRDRLLDHIVALIGGIKELKLHRPRRRAFTEDAVTRTAEAYMDFDVRAHVHYVLAYVTAQLFLLALIGMVLFCFPSTIHITAEIVSGYVLTALYLMGPMSAMAASFPVFGRARTSLVRLEALGLSTRTLATEALSDDGRDFRTFERITLRQAVCSYRDETDQDQFVLGPLDLTIRQGEVLFITGGNGSGKSTLAKMITGLYAPDEGDLCVDGVEITDSNRDSYRQLFSAVFSDYFLFESLMGLDPSNVDERAGPYLEALGLDHKVRIDNGAFSTIALSAGQRKRLALLSAYLEDRPVYLFDEWAADQDPPFKAVFYGRLLEALKAEGKTVIVITHDDRYFDAADRRFEMQDGRLCPVK